MKNLLLMTVGMVASVTVFAQEPSQKIQQLKNDPAQKERAAKADVFISKDHGIFDSTTLQEAAKPVANKKRAKKKNCKRKG